MYGRQVVGCAVVIDKQVYTTSMTIVKNLTLSEHRWTQTHAHIHNIDRM